MTQLIFQHSFPNALHVQMSQISQGTLPCISSKHIMSFDLNPMTKEIVLVTESELAIFDIDMNQFKAVKAYKSLLSYQFQQSSVIQNFGEQKPNASNSHGNGNAAQTTAGGAVKGGQTDKGQRTDAAELKGSDYVPNKDSKIGSAGNQQANTQLIQQVQKNQSFTKPQALYLYNYWVTIKNNKQVLFVDSTLQFSKDTISDSNGIVDMIVSQKSEEIITVTKDLRQIRIWTYMLYQKERPMPPIDELPVNVNHVDPNLHVFIMNKKNIHINLPIDQLCLSNLCDILLCSSSASNDLAFFTMKEGKNLYTLEYSQQFQQSQTFNSKGQSVLQNQDLNFNQTTKIPGISKPGTTPLNMNNRSATPMASAKAANVPLQQSQRTDSKVSLIKQKYTHDQGFFCKLPEGSVRNQYQLYTFQEFFYILNRRSQELTIWDLGLEQVFRSYNLLEIITSSARNTMKNSNSQNWTGLQIESIYPGLSNFKSGYLVIANNQNIYDVSLHSQSVIQRVEHGNLLETALEFNLRNALTKNKSSMFASNAAANLLNPLKGIPQEDESIQKSGEDRLRMTASGGTDDQLALTWRIDPVTTNKLMRGSKVPTQDSRAKSQQTGARRGSVVNFTAIQVKALNEITTGFTPREGKEIVINGDLEPIPGFPINSKIQVDNFESEMLVQEDSERKDRTSKGRLGSARSKSPNINMHALTNPQETGTASLKSHRRNTSLPKSNNSNFSNGYEQQSLAKNSPRGGGNKPGQGSVSQKSVLGNQVGFIGGFRDAVSNSASGYQQQMMSGGINLQPLMKYFIHYLPNQDGTKTVFMLKEGKMSIEVFTLYSNIDIVMERKTIAKSILPHFKESISFQKESFSLKNLVPVIDSQNHLHLLDILTPLPQSHLHISFLELLEGAAKQMVEIPVLPEKHKQKKAEFLRPQGHHSHLQSQSDFCQKIFQFDMKSRLAAFIDQQGMMCVVNTHFRTRKFVFLEDRLRIKDVHIMVNYQENTAFLHQLKTRTYTEEEFTRKENPYRHLDDYPDFDYLVAVITYDGLLLVVKNEGTADNGNEIKLHHRFNLQTAVLHSRYIPEKQKLLLIMKEGVLKVFEVFKEMLLVKNCSLMWPDITAIDLRLDEVLICGHESGIIYTQQIKGEIKITEMQLHNYHLSPIQQISLPLQGSPSKHFIALSSNKILTLFSMEEDRPLKVMRFHDNLAQIIFLGRNEVIAFERNYLFKIDLNDAQTFNDCVKKVKEEWASMIQLRIIKNQYIKKQLQVEETKNEQFYAFQSAKLANQKSNNVQSAKYEPSMLRYYLSMNGHSNLYNSLIQHEFDSLLNPGSSRLLFTKSLYLSNFEQYLDFSQQQAQQITGGQLASLSQAAFKYEIPKLSDYGQVKKTKQPLNGNHEHASETQHSKSNQKRIRASESQQQLKQKAFLEQIDLHKQMREVTRMTKHYKLSALQSYQTPLLNNIKASKDEKAISFHKGQLLNSVEKSQGQHPPYQERSSSLREVRKMASIYEQKDQSSITPQQDLQKVTEQEYKEQPVDENCAAEGRLSKDISQQKGQNDKGSQFQTFMKNLKQCFGKELRGLKDTTSAQSKGFQKEQRLSMKTQEQTESLSKELVMNLYTFPKTSQGEYSEELYRMKNKIKDLEDRAREASQEQRNMRAIIEQSHGFKLPGSILGSSQSFSHLFSPSASKSLLQRCDGQQSMPSLLLQTPSASQAPLLPHNLQGLRVKIQSVNMSQQRQEVIASLKQSEVPCSGIVNERAVSRHSGLPRTRDTLSSQQRRKDKVRLHLDKRSQSRANEETEAMLVEEEYGLSRDAKHALSKEAHHKADQRKIVIQQQVQEGGQSPQQRLSGHFYLEKPSHQHTQSQSSQDGLNVLEKNSLAQVEKLKQSQNQNQDILVMKGLTRSASDHESLSKSKRLKNHSTSKALSLSRSKQQGLLQTLSLNQQLLNDKIKLNPLPVTQYTQFPQTSHNKKRTQQSIFTYNIDEGNHLRLQTMQDSPSVVNCEGESSQRIRTAGQMCAGTSIIPLQSMSLNAKGIDGVSSFQSPVQATNIKIQVRNVQKRNERNIVQTLTFSQDSRSMNSNQRLRLVEIQPNPEKNSTEGQLIQALSQVDINPNTHQLLQQFSSTPQSNQVGNLVESKPQSRQSLLQSRFYQHQLSKPKQDGVSPSLAAISTKPTTEQRPRQLFQPNVKNLQLKVPATAGSPSSNQLFSVGSLNNIANSLQNTKRLNDVYSQSAIKSLKTTSHGQRLKSEGKQANSVQKEGHIRFEDDEQVQQNGGRRTYKEALKKILGSGETKGGIDGKGCSFTKPRISITQYKADVFKQPRRLAAAENSAKKSKHQDQERGKKGNNSKDSVEDERSESSSDTNSSRDRDNEDSTSVEGKGRRRKRRGRQDRRSSGSPAEGGVDLNEEERSLIVDEILRVNQQETKNNNGNLILEDLSDDENGENYAESQVLIIGQDGNPVYEMMGFDTQGIMGTNLGTATPPSRQGASKNDSTLLIIQQEHLSLPSSHAPQSVNINLHNLVTSTNQATHQWSKQDEGSAERLLIDDQRTGSLISAEGGLQTTKSHGTAQDPTGRRFMERKSSRFRLIIQTNENAAGGQGAQSRNRNQIGRISGGNTDELKSGTTAGPTKQIQLNIFKKKQESMMTNVFEEGIFCAHKMQIVKQTKKEKDSQKYMLMKELLRDRVSIQRQQKGFQIIIPKSLKQAKPTAALKPKEFDIHNILSEYNIYNLDFKDLLKLIKKKAMREGTLKPSDEKEEAKLEGVTKAAMNAVFGVKEDGGSTSGRAKRLDSNPFLQQKHQPPTTTETIITKEQIEIFLKKNLKKLLKLQDPKEMQDQNDLQAKLERMQNSQARKNHKEKERMFRLLQKEEELQRKREKAKQEREVNLQIRQGAKAQLMDEKRRLISQSQASMYRVVNVEDSDHSYREGTDGESRVHRGSILAGGQSGRRSSLMMSDEKSKDGGSTGELQMVYATEFKIAERKEEIKKRMEQMRQEKDQEKQRIEKMQIFNFIKDRIIRELIINRKVGAYIREREQSRAVGVDDNAASFNTEQLNRWANAQSKYAGYGFGNRSNSNSTGNFKDLQGAKSRFYNGRKVMTHENSNDGLDGDDMSSPLLYGEPDKFGVKVNMNSNRQANNFRNTVAESGGGNPQIFIKDDKGDIIPHTKSVKPVKSRQNSDLMLNKVLSSMEAGDGSMYRGQDRLSLHKEKSHTPSRNSNDTNLKINHAGGAKTATRNHQQSQRQRAQSKEVSDHNSDSQDSDEYYEEDPDNLRPPRSIISKNSSNLLGKGPKQFKMSLLMNERDQKIKDYNLNDNSSQQSSSNFQLPSQSANNPVQFVGGGGVSGAGDLMSMFDSEGDEFYMTKEEEVAKINQELQHQRILEKISEKILSKKISNFKKELLVRIAINLEMMETADLFTLEDLLERYETNDQEVKKLIIELFQEKYAIDLGSDLQTMVEETMNKVKDESKAMRRKNIKELLFKKIRMLNMISRFCKVAARNNDNLNEQKALKDLLDEDEDEFYSDDDEGLLKQEFQETVNEVLKRIFSKDDQVVSSQLRNFKKNYKMRFGPQPEYLIRDDGEAEAQSLQEQIIAQRLKAFRFNERNLLLILQEWLHPQEEIVGQAQLSESKLSRKKTNRRKYLYDPNAAINEDNLFETFYDLVQEVVNRIKKVQNNIKNNEKALHAVNKKRGSVDRGAEGDSNKNDGNVIACESKNVDGERVRQFVDMEMLAQRRAMTDHELQERRYCALRIAEFLNSQTMFGYQPPGQKDDEDDDKADNREGDTLGTQEGGQASKSTKGEVTVKVNDSDPDQKIGNDASRLTQNGEGLSDDQARQDERITGITNFLDPDLTRDKRIQRGSIQQLRETAPGYKDPLLSVMSMAFKSYAELLTQSV